MKRYVGSIYGRANAPEDVWAALGRLRAQTRVKVVRSSATPKLRRLFVFTASQSDDVEAPQTQVRSTTL